MTSEERRHRATLLEQERLLPQLCELYRHTCVVKGEFEYPCLHRVHDHYQASASNLGDGDRWMAHGAFIH